MIIRAVMLAVLSGVFIFILVLPFICETHKPVHGYKQELHSK